MFKKSTVLILIFILYTGVLLQWRIAKIQKDDLERVTINYVEKVIEDDNGERIIETRKGDVLYVSDEYTFDIQEGKKYLFITIKRGILEQRRIIINGVMIDSGDTEAGKIKGDKHE